MFLLMAAEFEHESFWMKMKIRVNDTIAIENFHKHIESFHNHQLSNDLEADSNWNYELLVNHIITEKTGTFP